MKLPVRIVEVIARDWILQIVIELMSSCFRCEQCAPDDGEVKLMSSTDVDVCVFTCNSGSLCKIK